MNLKPAHNSVQAQPSGYEPTRETLWASLKKSDN